MNECTPVHDRPCSLGPMCLLTRVHQNCLRVIGRARQRAQITPLSHLIIRILHQLKIYGITSIGTYEGWIVHQETYMNFQAGVNCSLHGYKYSQPSSANVLSPLRRLASVTRQMVSKCLGSLYFVVISQQNIFLKWNCYSLLPFTVKFR